MKRNFLLICLLFIVLLSGCSKPNALTHFNKDKLFSKALQYTSKNDIIDNKEVIAMLNATYLNQVDDEFNSKTHEVFIVGIYLPKYEEDNKIDYLTNSYSLTLNEVGPNSIKKLNNKHKMFGHLPLYNPWAKYYLVTFDKEKLNIKYQEDFSTYQKYNSLRYETIKLKLTNIAVGSTEISFQKAI